MDAEERAIKAIAECVGRDGGENVAIRVAEQILEAEQAAREDERRACSAEAKALCAKAIQESNKIARGGFALGLFEAIQHGDDEHKAWLKQAIEDFCAGRPVKRSCGKGSVEAAREKALGEALTALRSIPCVHEKAFTAIRALKGKP